MPSSIFNSIIHRHKPGIQLSVDLWLALALAYGGGLWLHWIHELEGAMEHDAPPVLLHWLRDATLLLPLMLGAVIAARLIARRLYLTGARRSIAIAFVASALMGGASPLHQILFDAHHHAALGASVLVHSARDTLLALIANLVIVSAVALIRQPRRWARQRVILRAVLAITLITNFLAPLAPTVSAAPAAQTANVCATATRTITYDVAAFQTIIPHNGWGDHTPDGLMFALSNADAIPNKDALIANPNLIEPLVIRAAVGDCILVNFRNDITGRRVGMHVNGISKDPKTSDGARIGNNPDTTVPTGGTITHTFFAHREGQFVINDYGSGLNYPNDTTSRGLYGALIVLPRGATWHDPRTGRDLLDASKRGVGAMPFADARVPGVGNDFRDFVAVFMDEPEGVLDRDGKPPVFPLTGIEDGTFGINYRSEPLRNRARAVLEHRGLVYDAAQNKIVATAPKVVTLPNGTVIQPTDHFCDGYVPELDQIVSDPGAQCVGEEFHLQSWPFGDPGKLTRKLADGTIVADTDSIIPKAYVGDPVRFRIVHPGVYETHTWHQHTNRWRHEPNDPDSTRLDVQSTGPGQTFELDFEGGAGQMMGTVGDQVFHCHLYPHFAEGFWGILRVYDRLRLGDQKNPDQTPIEALQPLPDRAGIIQAPDAMHPGFPLFVKGDYLQKTYRAPYAVTNDPFQAMRRPGDTIRTGTALERANMKLNVDGTANPGVFFVDPCPVGVPERFYYPAFIDAKIVYNKAGWHDPYGKLYAQAAPEPGLTALQKADQVRQAINAGAIQPEPFTIRARLGECVNLRTTNATHLDNDPNVPLDLHAPNGDIFHEPTPMTEMSSHVHLVRFDELGSDGTSIGWNYVQAPLVGQTYGYRWFVDLPLRTVFFHDHQFPTTHQQHGVWAAMNVEPADATWHDPKTGLETNGIGTVMDIRSPSGQDFREFTVHYSDFVPLFDAAGKPLNPPTRPDFYGQDQGGMAINYRNEPFPTRLNSASSGAPGEPAYIFSSAVHGDPATPIFRAYAGDPVVFRFMDGAHEEEHNFNLAGHRWLHEPDDPASNLYDTQAANIGEFFNFEVTAGRAVRRGNATTATAREKMREHAQMTLGATIVLPAGANATGGDYLYSSQPLNDLWSGMWGIFRVLAGRVSDLQPLPDVTAPPTVPAGGEWLALKPGQSISAPPPAKILNPCPPSAPIKKIAISIVQQKIVYNAAGDHDPNGIAYVLNQDLDLAGRPKAGVALKPLFIRANEGECVHLALTNRLPSAGIPVHAGDPVNPTENTSVTNRLANGSLQLVNATWRPSNRASVHIAGLIKHKVVSADGAAVGYNYDTTIAPGKTFTYYYWLDSKDIGIANIQNMANIRGTRHHGAWGGLVVEPKGAVYLDPKTGAFVRSGENAVIKYPIINPNGTTTYNLFREFIVNLQDGLNLFDKNGIQIADAAAHAGEAADSEDQGEKGINYRSEPFRNRLARDPQSANVFSSVVHGDPATPIFRSYVGEPVMVRVLNSQDLPRAHTFGIAGHEWRHEWNDPTSNIINAQGGLNTSRAFNLNLIGGAGGPQQLAGDYLYNDRNLFHNLSGGLWGLIRAHDTAQIDLKPLFASARIPVAPITQPDPSLPPPELGIDVGMFEYFSPTIFK